MQWGQIFISLHRNASIASIIAFAANFGGTYIIVALASVVFLASSTLLKTGRPKIELRFPRLHSVLSNQLVLLGITGLNNQIKAN